MAASHGFQGFARPPAGFRVLMLALACCTAVAVADDQPGAGARAALPAGAGSPSAAESQATVTPVAVAQLVHATLDRVNRANRSGDYRPVHAQLTPAMRKLVTIDEIARALAAFRDNSIDLSPVARIEPEFVSTPVVDAGGLLQAMGVFQTRPRLVRFKLAYRQVGDAWLLEDFALDTPTAQEWASTRSGGARASAGEPPATTRW